MWSLAHAVIFSIRVQWSRIFAHAYFCGVVNYVIRGQGSLLERRRVEQPPLKCFTEESRRKSMAQTRKSTLMTPDPYHTPG